MFSKCNTAKLHRCVCIRIPGSPKYPKKVTSKIARYWSCMIFIFLLLLLLLLVTRGLVSKTLMGCFKKTRWSQQTQEFQQGLDPHHPQIPPCPTDWQPTHLQVFLFSKARLKKKVPLFKRRKTNVTLPPIIMEVENGMSPILVSFHFRVMFHFYDYGRKGMSIPSGFWLTNQIK